MKWDIFNFKELITITALNYKYSYKINFQFFVVFLLIVVFNFIIVYILICHIVVRFMSLCFKRIFCFLIIVNILIILLFLLSHINSRP